jgi:hypothetical protein
MYILMQEEYRLLLDKQAEELRARKTEEAEKRKNEVAFFFLFFVLN